MLEQSVLSLPSDRLRIFMAAGEVSGDRQAAHLARALLRQDPYVTLYGSGGDRMREAGVDIRVHTSRYGSVGFQESLRFIRPLRRVLGELRSLLLLEPPDIAVLVDNEGFNGLLARFLHKEGIPFIYYFPPQVWLWGEWRARAIAQRAQSIITAFEAEAAIYRREGGNVACFGHPLLDIVKTEPNRDALLASFGITPAHRTIALMPGSRFQELDQLLKRMLGAIRIIKRVQPDLQVIIPLAASHLSHQIQEGLAREEMTDDVTIIDRHIYTCLSACEMAMLSSGTATLEAALLGVPMVVAYRVQPITFFLARKLVKVPFIAMPNILLGEKVVPELVQDDVTPEHLAAEALHIIETESYSKAMRSRLSQVRALLGTEGVLERAADFVLKVASQVRSVPMHAYHDFSPHENAP